MESAFKTDHEAEDMRKWCEWYNSSEPDAIQARELSEQHQAKVRQKEYQEREASKAFLNNYIVSEGLVTLIEELRKSNKIVKACELNFIQSVENLRISSVTKSAVLDLLKAKFISHE